MMKQKEIVDSVFRMADSKELLSYLKELASRDPKVAKEMEHRFLTSREWDYKSDIDEAFDEIIEHQFYEETMHDWNAITENCRGILSKARAYMNRRMYVAAADVGIYMLETLFDVFDYSEIDEFPYDEDYMIRRGDGVDYDPGQVGFVKEAADFIVEALSGGRKAGQLSDGEFNDLLSRFKKIATDISGDSCIDGYRDALASYNAFARSFQSREEHVTEMLEILDNNSDEKTAAELYDMLSSSPAGVWTLEKYAHQYIRFRTVAEPYVQMLEADGKYIEAIAAIQEHFGMKYPESDCGPLSRKLYELIWKTGDPAQRREVALYYFESRADKVRYYHDYKSTVPEAEWPSMLSRLLKHHDDSFTRPEWRYQVYMEEGMNKELMSLIRTPEKSILFRDDCEVLSNQISHLVRYGGIFTDAELSSLVNDFTKQLYDSAHCYDAKTYHTLVSSIRTLSRAGKEARAKMEDFTRWLKTEFPRRRKLLELL